MCGGGEKEARRAYLGHAQIATSRLRRRGSPRWARGALKQTIFVDEDDHQRYIRLLERVVRWTSWRCLGWCLMGNHMHMLVETPLPNLGRGMQRLHGIYG